jgi:hypothetical protein
MLWRPIDIRFYLSFLLFCVFTFSATADAAVIREWKAAELAQWTNESIASQRAENGELVLDTKIGDAMLISPVFAPFRATSSQEIVVKIQSDISGPAGFFWTNTEATRYNGFSGEKFTAFNLVAGLHTYRITPYWQAEKNIIRLRLDFPERRRCLAGTGKATLKSPTGKSSGLSNTASTTSFTIGTGIAARAIWNRVWTRSSRRATRTSLIFACFTRTTMIPALVPPPILKR